MGNPAERIDQPQAKTDRSKALERLLANLGDRARDGAGTVTLGTANAPLWSDLEHAVATRMATSDTPAMIRGREAAITAAALNLLNSTDNRDQRRAAYLTMVGEIDQRAEAWSIAIAPDVLARQLHRTLLWGTAWHLLGADIPMAKIVGALASDHTPPPQPVPTWRKVWTMSGGALKAGSSRAMVLLKDLARGIATYREEQAALQAAAAKAEEERRAVRVAERRAEQEQAARAAHAQDMARNKTTDSPDMVPGQTIALDGRRLRGSVVGTWLLLVVMSWVSLLWGAMISLPFGIGIGIFATLFAGIVAVPVFGTVFGFLGMGVARDSTLRQMGFKELPEGHVLRSIATHYCQTLDIPVPRLGTIDAFNAFAMGSDRNDATVALGRPLIDSLTPQETAAVLAHELGHVVSGDMRKMMLMRTFQNATVWFALVQGVKQFVRWIICWAAELCILAFSRKREYVADAIGAALAGKDAMIGALRKLDAAPALTSNERTHARFMVRGKPFSTHPGTTDRITAIEQETYIRRLPRR